METICNFFPEINVHIGQISCVCVCIYLKITMTIKCRFFFYILKVWTKSVKSSAHIVKRAELNENAALCSENHDSGQRSGALRQGWMRLPLHCCPLVATCDIAQAKKDTGPIRRKKRY